MRQSYDATVTVCKAICQGLNYRNRYQDWLIVYHISNIRNISNIKQIVYGMSFNINICWYLKPSNMYRYVCNRNRMVLMLRLACNVLEWVSYTKINNFRFIHDSTVEHCACNCIIQQYNFIIASALQMRFKLTTSHRNNKWHHLTSLFDDKGRNKIGQRANCWEIKIKK